MGILRTDRVSGLGGANAINGSVFYGNGEQVSGGTTANNILITERSSDFTFGTGDFTIEGWFYTPDLSNWNLLVGDNVYASAGGWGLYFNTDPDVDWWKGGASVVSGATPTENTWHHVAFSRESGTNRVFLDGALGASASDSTNYTATQILIGANQLTTADVSQWGFHGYVSNLRVIKGEAIYTAAFTAPTTRLEKTDNTVLLCCQSPGNVLQEATGKTLYTLNKPVASHFAPDVGEEHGTTFTDNTKFDTLSYMVPPKGTTESRNRGRALIAGGTNGGGWGTKYNTISYIQIQSGGIAKDFGDLSSGRSKVRSVSSSSRAVFAGGSEGASANNPVDTMEYVTIATTGNVTAFGDALESNRRPTGGVSNDTRGLFGGGYIAPAGKAEIDHIVIASTGSVTDYGDLLVSGEPNEGSSNSTRGVWMGGGWGAQIEYVTIASTGSGADFGNIQNNRANAAGTSSSTRALCAGGGSADNDITFIQFASLGNDSDFGDLTQGRRILGGTSNGIRGIFAGGYTPDYNIIDYVNIATTGNAQDFGDMTTAFREPTACSDSHGGIS